MVGGWLGRVSILHITLDAYHTAPAHLFFLLLLFSLSVSCIALDGYFADMRSVLVKLLRAKYGATARECVKQIVDLRKLQT